MMLPVQATDTTFRYTGGGIPKGIVIVIGLVLLYLLPSMLALAGGKRRRWKVVALNTLLGWTIVGWVAAMLMVWAYEAPDPAEGTGGLPDSVPGNEDAAAARGDRQSAP